MDCEVVSEVFGVQPFIILAFCFFMAYTYVTQKAVNAPNNRQELEATPPTAPLENLTKAQKVRLTKIMKKIDLDMKQILEIGSELDKIEKKILEKSAEHVKKIKSESPENPE